ncbi:hypothetical protein PMAYCL1PPCAC_27328, partial [Pristionchus mayeri]
RGCITNNETLLPGLYQVGYNRLWDIEYVICNSSYCNTAWDWRLNVTPAMSFPANTGTTTSPTRQALFENEYMKMFTSIKSAIDNFITKFAELYG